MHPIESLRELIDAILHGQPDVDERRCGFVHLYGVAQTAALLAERRGLDANLAMAAGMLHDIATYRTNDPTDHAHRSAVEARPMLEALAAFSGEQIDAICLAIARHSDKDVVDGPLDELLKDADVLQHHLYNVDLGLHPGLNARLKRVLAELGMV